MQIRKKTTLRWVNKPIQKKWVAYLGELEIGTVIQLEDDEFVYEAAPGISMKWIRKRNRKEKNLTSAKQAIEDAWKRSLAKVTPYPDTDDLHRYPPGSGALASSAGRLDGSPLLGITRADTLSLSFKKPKKRAR